LQVSPYGSFHQAASEPVEALGIALDTYARAGATRDRFEGVRHPHREGALDRLKHDPPPGIELGHLHDVVDSPAQEVSDPLDLGSHGGGPGRESPAEEMPPIQVGSFSASVAYAATSSAGLAISLVAETSMPIFGS
jgi:hypothetical protein